MLKLFRQRKAAVRVLLFGVVGIVGLMMVVTLVPGLGSVDVSMRDPQGVIARLGDATVTQTEVQRQFQQQARQFGAQSEQMRPFLMQGIIDDLITLRVVEYQAQQMGLEATPEEVALQLRQIGMFYPDGKFVGAEAYRRIVQQQLGLSVPEYEDRVRRQVQLNKLVNWVTAGVTVSPAAVEEEYRRQEERVRIEFVAFRPDHFTQQIQPSDDDLRGYYEANRDRYQVPERRAVRYVPIDDQVLAQRLRVTPEEIEVYYRRNRQAYVVPERVRARHILLLRPQLEGLTAKVEVQGADPLRKEGEEVLAQLQQGKAFAPLAKAHSKDQATAEQGGEIGWVQRGQTVPEVEQMLFSLPPNKPELVETSYGFHVVEVLEREPQRVKGVAEVRGQIEAILKQQKVQQGGIEQARKIVDAVRSGKPLADAAREAGWTVEESSLFTRDQFLPAFGSEKDFQEAAFRLPAESAGQPQAPVSEPVQVPSGYAVLQLKEVQPEQVSPFDEVRARVDADYRRQRGIEMAQAAATKLAEAAKERGSLKDAARAQGADVTRSELFGREDPVAGLGSARDIASVAFSLPVESISQPLEVSGAWTVLQVKERREADLARLTEEERQSLRELLLERKQTLAWRMFTLSLRKQLEQEGKLQLNQAAIDRLTRVS